MTESDGLSVGKAGDMVNALVVECLQGEGLSIPTYDKNIYDAVATTRETNVSLCGCLVSPRAINAFTVGFQPGAYGTQYLLLVVGYGAVGFW